MNRLDALARDPVIGPYLPELNEKVADRKDDIFQRNKKGILLAHALDKLPDAKPSSTDANQDRIRIGTSADLSDNQRASLLEALGDLRPWRKGPFKIFGIRLDSEWDSSVGHPASDPPDDDARRATGAGDTHPGSRW